MTLKHGPYDMAREMMRYPWIFDLLKVNGLLKKLSEERSGNYRKAISILVNRIVQDIVDALFKVFTDPDRLILHQGMISSEVFQAMGLNTWINELFSFILPFVEPHSVEKYIDAAENEGFPPDLCNFPKMPVGMHIMDHIPRCKAAVVPAPGV